jgi:hypothetical protein
VLGRVELVAVEAGVEERRDGGIVRVVVDVRVRPTTRGVAAPLARIPNIPESLPRRTRRRGCAARISAAVAFRRVEAEERRGRCPSRSRERDGLERAELDV